LGYDFRVKEDTSPEVEGDKSSKISFTRLDMESVSALIDSGLKTVDSIIVSLDQDQEGKAADAKVEKKLKA
jgi:hypothetical protein